MSTGADCQFYEKEPGKWFYKMQQWPYGECPNYDKFGPFPTWLAAEKHMSYHHANPGGYSVSALPGCPHDLLVENMMPSGTWTCNRCGEYLTVKPTPPSAPKTKPAPKTAQAKPRQIKNLMPRKSIRIIKLAGKNIHVLSESPDARLVWGTRTHKWYLVGKENFDWATGITPAEFEQIGAERAKAKYLAPSLLVG